VIARCRHGERKFTAGIGGTAHDECSTDIAHLDRRVGDRRTVTMQAHHGRRPGDHGKRQHLQLLHGQHTHQGRNERHAR